MTTILCIDTSSAACSVSLSIGDEVISEIETTPQKHSERVLEMCDALLKTVNIGIDQIDAIAVTQGPGSFTGVRIGISVAQGIAFAANIPAIPVSSLAVMAQKAYELHQVERVLCLSDARMNEIYCGKYVLEDGLMQLADNECLVSPINLTMDDSNWASCGNAWIEYAENLANYRNKFSVVLPEIEVSADYLVPFARKWYSQARTVEAQNLRPVYLRNDVAKKASAQ